MSMKGRTATDCSTIAGEAGESIPDIDAAGEVSAVVVPCGDNPPRSFAYHVRAKPRNRRAATVAVTQGMDDDVRRPSAPPARAAPPTAPASGTAGVLCVALEANANWRRTASRTLLHAISEPSEPNSIHCDSLKKYSRAVVSGAESIRRVMMGRRLDADRSTSL